MVIALAFRLSTFPLRVCEKKRTGYEEWQMLSGNSFVGTNELPTVRFKIDANYPIAAFMNIGFTHHYVIISKVKNVEYSR